MITCGSCGFRNADDAVFCGSCSGYLPFCAARAQPEPPPAPEARPEPEPPPVPESPAVRVPAPVPQAAAAPPAPPPDETIGTDQVPVVVATSAVVEGAELAAARGREDLAEQLRESGEQLAARQVQVAVVGEFKRGKSTLINALLQTQVCPVDADVVTSVPTLVRYGEQPRALAHIQDPSPGSEVIPLEAIADYVSERGNPENRRQLASVEVQLRHRMLRSGMCLVDTPGVGGLDSAHGVFTLAMLDVAHALVFVTDASQELTAPELEFLRSAAGRVPVAACVVTKTDLYPAWRRIVSLDEGHLARAGLDIPVIAVSSFLRLRARQDPALSEESGFRPLVRFLAEAVLGSADAQAAEVAARRVQFVADELARQVAAERAVVERPEEAEKVTAALAADRDRAARLSASNASWQQMLADGIQDLVADVEHDLNDRFRTVLRDVEGIIDEGDPAVAWPDIEVWLSRQLASAAVANRDMMSARAAELVAAVADEFDLTGGGVEVGRTSRDAVGSVKLPGVESPRASSARSFWPHACPGCRWPREAALVRWPSA